MEKKGKMQSEKDTGLIWRFKELKLSYHIGETLLFSIYVYTYIPIMVT